MEGSLKGVILAGGTGSRLHPLTLITNKHLLPIYDRPMIAYAIEALVKAGVTELMLVTGGTHAGEFFRLLGDGHGHGIGASPGRDRRAGRDRGRHAACGGRPGLRMQGRQ